MYLLIPYLALGGVPHVVLEQPNANFLPPTEYHNDALVTMASAHANREPELAQARPLPEQLPAHPAPQPTATVAEDLPMPKPSVSVERKSVFSLASYGQPLEANPCICKPTCWYLYGDMLYMRVRGAGVAYAQPFDGVTATAVPIAPAGVAEPDFSAGFRIGTGYRLDDASFIEATFTAYRSDTYSFTGLPAGAPAGSVIRSLVTHPNTLDAAADSDSAEADYDINLYQLDFDWKGTLLDGPRYWIAYRVGLRLAHLDQDLSTRFNINGLTTVDTDIDFDGGGPRVGIEGEYAYPSGLFTYGRAAFAALAGRFEANYRQQSVIALQQANSGISDERVVPVTDFELGLGWQFYNGRFRWSFGYNIQTWHNMMTTGSFINAVQNREFNRGDSLQDSLTFDGIVSRLELRW